MKKRSFVAGMLTMLLIMTLVVPAAATVGKVTKELEYRDISVTLDGVKLDLKDAKGNPVEPFMFEGTNYLPVRALAESLGLNVAWDGKTATVVLTSPDAGQKTSFGEGMYLVGKDIPAGTYLLTCNDPKWGAYWSRNSDATGEYGTIIANDNFETTSYVTVVAGEYFKLSRATAVLQ
ncbi:MAG: hypothetical protein IJ266_03690 [Elusimicrobiaceae bacterium]|nr:hypothetical protein [Elusimicrobiaceae bacterium]